MLPFLIEGETPVKLVNRKPEILDAVLFKRRNGVYVLHRIIDEDKKYYYICGDNQTKIEPVKKQNIIAVMDGYFKDGKYISHDNPEYVKAVKERCASVNTRKIIRPMPKHWSVLFEIYSAALTGRKAVIPKGFKDYDKLYNLAVKHCIAGCCFKALDKEIIPDEIYKKWKNYADGILRKNLLFEAERKAVFALFAEEDIRYIPLKGIIIEDYYPQPQMREYCDNDILLYPEDIDKAVTVMANRGYKIKDACQHHVGCLKEPVYNFELHFSLIDQGDSGHEELKTVFDRLVPDKNDSHLFYLSETDFYMHFIAHYKRHFEAGGSGLRRLGDAYLLKVGNPYFSSDELKSKLKDAGLLEFDEKIYALSEKLMLRPESVEFEEIEYVISSGDKGTNVHHIKNDLGKKSKIAYLFSRLFFPIDTLALLYPNVKKYPFLYPCYSLKRILGIFSPKKFSRIMNEIRVFIKFRKK